MWFLKRGISFLWNADAIVFFAGYPYPERQSDGYFQRVQMVDRLFARRSRIYIDSDERSPTTDSFDRPKPQVLVIRIVGGPGRRWLLKALALLAVLRCRKIYIHSIFCMQGHGIRMLMHMPGITKVIDIHGAVPEEVRIQNDVSNAARFEALERLAVRKSDLVVAVSHTMKSYLCQKYGRELRAPIAILPMFIDIVPPLFPRPYHSGNPIVIYAGGLQKWQQVEKMIDAISRTVAFCVHRLYCPDPDSVRKMLSEEARPQVTIDRKTHAELTEIYATCHYGFILRDNTIVNHVACPTKLVEYLAMGIVPIVDSEKIGDFTAMGMRFVTLAQLLQGDLPTEVKRTEMVRDNMLVYEHLRNIRRKGEQDICANLT
jgi:hypothetical protein